MAVPPRRGLLFSSICFGCAGNPVGTSDKNSNGECLAGFPAKCLKMGQCIIHPYVKIVVAQYRDAVEANCDTANRVQPVAADSPNRYREIRRATWNSWASLACSRKAAISLAFSTRENPRRDNANASPAFLARLGCDNFRPRLERQSSGPTLLGRGSARLRRAGVKASGESVSGDAVCTAEQKSREPGNQSARNDDAFPRQARSQHQCGGRAERQQ